MTPPPVDASRAGVRHAPAWRDPEGILLVALLAAAVLVGFSGDDYALEIGFRLVLLLTLAEAWNLMAGYGGMVSLGTAAFFGIGAYVLTGLVNEASLPLALALPAAGAVSAAVAAVVSRAVFRLRGLYFTVGTLALAEAVRLFMINYNGFGGASGLFLTQDPPGLRGLYALALGLLVLSAVAMTLATRSRLSILLRAVRDDEDAAAQIGVRAFRVKLGAFVVASALTGVAGALQGLKLGAVEPYGTFGVHWTVTVLSIVVIGGQGMRAGPLLGAIFVVGLGELLADWPALHLALTGSILIVVIRYAPQGLAGLVPRLGARAGR